MFKKLLQKAKAIFAPKNTQNNQSSRRMPTPQELAAMQNKAVKTFKVERFFYRNAGLNRQEKNQLIGRLRNKKLSKAQRELIKAILKESPKNVPYVRGRKILPQHAGSATPKELIAGAK